MTKGKFVIVTGDKGGVGKSVMSTITTDYLLDQGKSAVLIEGDPQIGDVAIRFIDKIGSGVLKAIQADLTTAASGSEKAQALAEQLEGVIEDVGEEVTIVLNAPASLSSTIDESAADFREICEALDLELVVAWMVGKDHSSVSTAQESKLIKAAHRCAAVINFEDPDATEWCTSGMSKKWKSGGDMEVVMPQMPGLVPVKIKDFRKVSFAAIGEGENGSDGKPLRLAYRIPLRRWVRETYAAVCEPVIDG